MASPIYLDHLSTTPIDPRVLDAMLPYLRERFGHPAARSHAPGWEAEQAVEAARARVADLVGADPREIVFTSGGTEADNLAILGALEAAADRGAPLHVVTTAVESRSVLDPLRHAASRGVLGAGGAVAVEVTQVAPDATGRVRAADVVAAARETTALVAVQAANAEIGTLQPVAEIGASLARTPPDGAAAESTEPKPQARSRRLPHLHCDAAYAAPWIGLDVRRDGVHTMSLTAHRLGGPKGAGALYVRRRDPRVRLIPRLCGGGHERGLRPGTPDVAAIVGFGVAAELVRREREADAARVAALRDRLEAAVLAIPGVARHGDPHHRLPSVTTLSFEGVEAEALLMAMPDVAASSGAGCTSASLEPSHVMRAIGVPEALANQSVRFSLGRTTTADEIERVIARVVDAVERLRQIGLRR